MPGRNTGKSKGCDGNDEVVMKAIHDKSGWRVQLHIHIKGHCSVLDGHVRYTDEHTCHEQGRLLHGVLDDVIGIIDDEGPTRPNGRN